MKIQCQSCQAKYTIADEKVLGKVVKIRCKKCSATIVINGNETRPAEDNQDTNVFDYAQSNDQWTVNVADGDQRTMTPQEIAKEYAAGVVNDETYCWKDGMADWLPLREIEQLYGAVRLSGAGSRGAPIDELSVPPQSVRDPNQVPAAAAAPAAIFTPPGDQGGDASPFAPTAHANGNGSGGNLFGDVQAAPAAARRGGGRGQGADLFGNAAHAGGEEDVMTSAPAGGSAAGGTGLQAASTDDQKLTGQRNENSVLFSLNALTSNTPAKTAEPSRGQTTATSDGSGLIDIRALSANMGNEGESKKDKNARVDDIMNLSGGGAFGAALAAPILAPPPLEAADPAVYGGVGGEAKSNKTMLLAILGGAFIIAVGIIVAVVLVTKSSTTADANANPSGTVSAGASPTTSVAANDTSTATGTVTAPTATDNTPPPPGTGNAAGHTTGGSKPAGGQVVAANTPKPQHDDSPKLPDPPKADQPKDFNSALAQAAGQPANKPADTGGGGGSTAPFDRGAAAGSLGSINVQSCKKGDGPTGSGHVKVTFAPNGSVSAAVVDGGPFPGTPVGGCIAGKFRGAHVPAFSGGAVTVGKSFTIN